MLSNIVSKLMSVAMFFLAVFTAISYVFQIAKPFLLADGMDVASFDSATKGVPLLNGATTTTNSLITKFKSNEWLRSFVNKTKFCILVLLCKPLSLFTKRKEDLYTTLAMSFFLVLDFCFVLFCAYAAMRTFCPNFADSIGLTDFVAVSNIKEVKGIRQCYLYLKQQFFFVA